MLNMFITMAMAATANLAMLFLSLFLLLPRPGQQGPSQAAPSVPPGFAGWRSMPPAARSVSRSPFWPASAGLRNQQ